MRRKNKNKNKNKWTPLQPATMADGRRAPTGFFEMWKNDIYTVLVGRRPVFDGQFEVTHLSIRRNDRGHQIDWRHKQYIKNQICGTECEAVEIFPAESRLLDEANQFHLWVLPEGRVIPFGYTARSVSVGGTCPIGSYQRPFEHGLTPDDALSMEDVSQALENHKN